MASGHDAEESTHAIEREIALLEQRLADAKLRLGQTQSSSLAAASSSSSTSTSTSTPLLKPSVSSLVHSPTHYLLLLSDSQLPIGSFAFSSGLESYLAHCRRSSSTSSRSSGGGGTFTSFLPLSLSSFAATTLPFVLAAHRDPSRLVTLDDQLDAAVVCTVGRRASVAQGRALLSIWERSFRDTLPAAADADVPVLRAFSALLKEQAPSSQSTGGDDVGVAAAAAAAAAAVPPAVSAHLAPLFGVICAVVGLTLRQTAYVYMVGHVKALVSAAVRASMFGPYQAQKVLAGEHVQHMIAAVIEWEWDTPVELAGQTVPVMDLWIGRHEVLYSRIFNS
ncbi:Urease accessory protein UreF [Moelleriella libera RCEF 2490]|uniref:Urease accessory protein UreF n=1 Tax=Moelleriella libera RCEF 2490 TaxID=1081109 RepID=A0A168E1R1_9HYPO|nr:Urease accessory protein UreF [Moelleriella libera RCEF 2490]